MVPLVIGEPFTITVGFNPSKSEFDVSIWNTFVGKLAVPEPFLDLFDMRFSGDADINVMGFTNPGTFYKKLRTKKTRINLTLGLDPQIPVGTEIVYGCEEDFVFSHDWYSRPTIVLTCNNAGEFDGFPGFWPACINRN